MIDKAVSPARLRAAPARRASLATWIGRCLMLSLALLTGCSTVRPWINADGPGAGAGSRTSTARATPAGDGGHHFGWRGARGGVWLWRAARPGRVRFDLNGKHLTLLEATDLISGMSGGSIVSAYYAAFGRGACQFRAEFLRKNFQQGPDLPADPPRQPAHELSSPWFGRSNLFAAPARRAVSRHDLCRRGGAPAPPAAHRHRDRPDARHRFRIHLGPVRADLLRPGQVPLSFAVAASSSVPSCSAR